MTSTSPGITVRSKALILAMTLVLAALAFCALPQMAYAAVGDTPVHTKNLTDNQDGTYTLSLDVVGDAEKQPNNVNVIVIVDTSGSMTQQRMTAAKNAVNSLANSLYAYNTQSEPNTVEMALVRFATSSSVAQQPTSNATTFRNAVNGLGNTGNGGTNWESALQTAYNVSFNDNDQTFVVFVSDGNPTFRTSQNGWNDWNYQYQQYGSGQETATNVQRCYTTAVDDAQALAQKVGVKNFFTIGAFGNVDRMEQLTDDAGSDSSTNYYNASDTAALNQAIADILAKIEMAGIANAEIEDGTTNQVTTTSGEIANLLEVDTSSFKYYKGGSEWADAPKAKFENGSVEWDLSEEGVLENGVRYTVTFDVYPSQETYDTIAKLKNGDIKYSDLDPEIQKYIIDNGGNSYSLRTNTDAVLKYDDTRTDEAEDDAPYTDPSPVATDASTLTVSKTWEGAEADVDSIEMSVLMDNAEFHGVELTKAEGWSASSFISIGIIKNGQPLPGAMGHDFSFAELDSTQYRWELDAPTVHPMLVNGTLTMLVKSDAAHPVPSGAQTYTINGATYYVDSATAGLTATNHRRSNLNLTKVVTGENAPENALFPFALTVNNSKAASGSSSDTSSDYYVWFSIYDTKAGAPVTDATVSGATGPNDQGYYYAPSGSAITVQMKANWNLRFINLPSGSTYEFTESDAAGFEFVKAEGTGEADSTFKGDKTSTGTIESAGGKSYAVTYTNNYRPEPVKASFPVKKVIDKADNLTGPAVWSYAIDVTANDGAPKADTMNGTVNQDADTINFGDFTFNAPGTYTYTVSETGEVDGVTNDKDAAGKTVTITVEDKDSNGKLTATVAPADGITFTNTYDASGEAVLKATKAISGAAWPANKTITFTLAGEGGTLPETKTATLTEAGEATFGAIKYTAADAGKTYTYTISEDGFGTGWTGSGDVTATVKVTDSGNGTLNAEVTYTPENATITNTYAASGTAEITVTKKLEGRDWLDGEKFTFTLKDADGKELGTKEVTKANPTATFDPIAYNEADAGKTYTYTVTEAGTLPGGVSKSADVTATVKITDNGDGKLTTDVTYTNNATITNTYNAEGEATLEATKELVGRDWLEGETYTFTLKDSEGNVLDEQTVDSNTKVTFDAIEYDEGDAGQTFTYTITETTTLPGGMTKSDDITATVKVTDNGDGTLKTDVSYDNDDKIVNTYKASGEAVLEVTKAVKGADWPKDKKLTFTLAGEGGTLPETKTVELTEPGKATFDAIKYTEADAGKTYTYTISEDGFGTGWTGSAAITATVKVTDNGNGTLTTDVTYTNNDTITNTYKASGTAEIEVAKVLTGRDWLDGEKFTFTLKGADGTEIESIDVTKDNPTAKFAAISYDEADAGKTYTYTVTETSKLPGGITKSKDVTATVVVSDNGDGTLKTDVSYDNEGKITNTYNAEGEATLEATKELVGRDWLEGETYTFTLKDSEGNVLDEQTVDSNTKVTFDAIEYDEGDAGQTFTYTISETSTLPDGMTKSADITATVKVTDNGDGTLKTEVSYDNDDKIVNTYKAEGSIELLAGKKLEVKDPANNPPDVSGAYTIAISGADGAPMPATTSFKNADGKGTATSFGAIKYTEADAGKTYTYTITEEGSVEGVTNGTSSYDVKVKVTDNGDGTLKAEVVEGNATTIFTNTYKVSSITLPTEDQFTVTKKLTGIPLTGGAFEFTLQGKDGAPMPENAEASNDAEGNVVFDTITYDAPGTYNYTISEKNTGKSGYTYSENVANVIVTVEDNGKGELEATVGYTGETVFNNTYEADGEWPASVKKTLNGRTLEAGQFTFQLLDEDGKVLQTKTNNASGAVDFDAIKYDEKIFDEDEADKKADEKKADEGAIETAADDAAADEAATDEAATDEAATDEAATEGVATDEAVTDEATTDEAPAANEATNDGTAETAAANDNGFGIVDVAHADELEATDKAASDFATLDDKDSAASEKADDATLGTAADEAAEPSERTKTFKYTIVEVSDGKAGYIYDGHEVAVTVTVTDKGDGKLEVTPEYSGSTEFVNTYKATGEVSLSATKAVTGATLAAGQFSFQLKSGNEVLQTKTNDASGAVAFDPIAYTEADAGKSYDYQIVEVNDGQQGYTYDGHTTTATVTITDNGDGTLATAVKYSDGDVASFVNPYDPLATSAPFKAVKKLEGRDLKADEFKFELKDEGGNVVATATNAADGTVAFGNVKFDKVGTFTFTATEVKGDDSTITYDSSTKTYKVEVTDEAGQLVAKVTCDEGDAPVFTNKYTPKSTPVTPIPLPATGDNLPIYALIAVALIAAVVCVVAIRRRSLAVAKAERRASHSYYGRKH